MFTKTGQCEFCSGDIHPDDVRVVRAKGGDMHYGCYNMYLDAKDKVRLYGGVIRKKSLRS